MGRLTYDGVVSAEFDDRLLAHLQIVIGNKLRRGESLHFSWRDDAPGGSGRTTIWIHPAVSLVYRFSGGRAPSINRAWLDALMAAANSPSGLHVVPEPESDREH
jgi:hypothetical protein